MGLDSYVFEENTKNADEHGKEIAYWRKTWFLHELVASMQDDPEFNCVRFYLDKEIVQDIYTELCKESDRQNRSLEKFHFTESITTEDINEFKKVIIYLIKNPNAKLYFYSWY